MITRTYVPNRIRSHEHTYPLVYDHAYPSASRTHVPNRVANMRTHPHHKHAKPSAPQTRATMRVASTYLYLRCGHMYRLMLRHRCWLKSPCQLLLRTRVRSRVASPARAPTSPGRTRLADPADPRIRAGCPSEGGGLRPPCFDAIVWTCHTISTKRPGQRHMRPALFPSAESERRPQSTCSPGVELLSPAKAVLPPSSSARG
jgi:hypothetical protein